MGSASDGSNDGAEVSAVVIPAIGVMNGLWSVCNGLMHSYHNVAELRQFRGILVAKATDPQPVNSPAQASRDAAPLA